MKKTGPPLNTQTPVHVFKMGDTVKLKSGGPLMSVKYTIERPEGQKVFAAWFNGTSLDADLFMADMLKLMSPAP